MSGDREGEAKIQDEDKWLELVWRLTEEGACGEGEGLCDDSSEHGSSGQGECKDEKDEYTGW